MKDKWSGMSTQTFDFISVLMATVITAMFLYTFVAPMLGLKTSLLQERIDRVIANNR